MVKKPMPPWGWLLFVLPGFAICAFGAYRIGIPADRPFEGYMLIALTAAWAGMAVYLIAMGFRGRRP
jgi:hypothetical protein